MYSYVTLLSRVVVSDLYGEYHLTGLRGTLSYLRKHAVKNGSPISID